jgi:acyl carrier protein
MSQEKINVFLKNLVEVLETDLDEIDLNTELLSIPEWDSLSRVSFAAMADIKYNKKLLSIDIKSAKTVKDLFLLVN